MFLSCLTLSEVISSQNLVFLKFLDEAQSRPHFPKKLDICLCRPFTGLPLGSPEIRPWGWVVGALPPHPRTVDLKVSEMSAFGHPRGCASGSLWVNISKKSFFWNHFHQKWRFGQAKKKYGLFPKCFFAEGRFPATPSFWRPENPENLKVQKFNSSNSSKSRSSKI